MKKQTINRILHETRDIYNQIAPDFSRTRGRLWLGFGDFAKYVEPGCRVLDLGCGNGRLYTVFADSGVSYLGLDNSEELIKIARERFKNNPEVKFDLADLAELSLPAANFDLVLAIAALHHLPDSYLRRQILKQIFQTLKPGGRLVLLNWNLWQTVNGFKYWPNLFNYRQKISRGVWSLNDAFIPWKNLSREHPRYIHSFSLAELKKNLRAAGFDVETLRYELKGRPANRWSGGNSLAVARKP